MSPSRPPDPAIALARVSKRFGRAVALDQVSLTAQPGQIIGLVGENGAGKSTLLRIAAGYLDADEGHARVLGHDVSQARLAARAAIGYLPESAPLHRDMRVCEYLAFRARLKGVARRAVAGRLRAVSEQLALTGRERALIGTLSRGYRQRVALADALIHEPPVLLLDEPTTGLDPVQRRELRTLIAGLAGQHTVILSSHALDDVENLADSIVVLARGQVVASGILAALRARTGLPDAASLEDVFLALAALAGSDLDRDDSHDSSSDDAGGRRDPGSEENP